MLTATYHNMLNIVNKLFGGLSSNNLKKYENVVKKINNFESQVSRLSDDDLKESLLKFGYSIARRTVAKYRDQLNLPVARLRKKI